MPEKPPQGRKKSNKAKNAQTIKSIHTGIGFVKTNLKRLEARYAPPKGTFDAIDFYWEVKGLLLLLDKIEERADWIE